MQKTSIYSKLNELLHELSSSTYSQNDFIIRLRDNNNNFVYFLRNSAGDVVTSPCNDVTIRRNIQFSIELGLVADSDPLDLTEQGRRAIQPNRYDDVLRTAILSYLERNDVSWPRLENAIEEVSLPEPGEIYIHLSPPIPESVFRTCLYILSLCGADTDDNIIKPYNRKLYLTHR